MHTKHVNVSDICLRASAFDITKLGEARELDDFECFMLISHILGVERRSLVISSNKLRNYTFYCVFCFVMKAQRKLCKFFHFSAQSCSEVLVKTVFIKSDH